MTRWGPARRPTSSPATGALLSGFGEALKQLDYVPCTESGVEYEQGFQAAETASPPTSG